MNATRLLAATTLACVPLHVTPAVQGAPAATASDTPLACPFEAGAMLAETRPDLPRGTDIPIDHIVVVMQENRSFDHIFQNLAAGGRPGVNAAPADAFNIDDHGKRRDRRRAALPCGDGPPHGWNAVHGQIADGAMSGFAASGGDAAMAYYDETWLPWYYALASIYAVADRYFASVPGPTWPNRQYMTAGTSFGHIDNGPPPPRDEERSIFHQLETAGVDWTVFAADDNSMKAQIFPALHAEKGEHFKDILEFEDVAAAGDLPAFSWVTSSLEHNEHRPKSVQAGQRFVADVVDAVTSSPNWPRTALFFMYDEHGGFYDHVPPPAACPLDDIAPIATPHDIPGPGPGFDRLGVRVPFVVVSAWARPGFVSHVVHDHTSVLRFVQARFDLPALGGRDANAEPPMEMFDFSRPSFATPPALPRAVIDPRFAQRCVDTQFTD